MGLRASSLFVVAVAVALAAPSLAMGASVLDTVKARKSLLCGVDPDVVGFAAADEHQRWSGFDADYCRAIAAAVLGNPNAVTFVPLTVRERFKALQTGQVDVLIRNTAWTMARDTAFGVTFAGVNFYNGLGFMVPKSLGVDSALQLSGAKVCVETGSATEIAIAAYFSAHGMTLTPFPVADAAKQRAAYDSGQCNVFTGDLVTLYTERLALTAPDDSSVLPELLSKEPYGPVVSDADHRWLAVVKWVHFALLNAEELGVTAANVDAMRASDNGDVRQLLGAEGSLGKALGLDPAWAANAIRAVGNYGEIYDRSLGTASRLKIPRGLNALWNNGGIQFAPPLR